MAPRSNRDELHSLEGSTPSPSACTCPWPIGSGTSLGHRRAASVGWTGGFDPRRALLVRVGSSAAERVSVKHRVVGSSPTPAACTEVIRLDEEPVLKTGGGTDRLWVRVGYRRAAWVASADRRHSTRPWCNGSTTGSNPVGQGSSPWGRALFWSLVSSQ
jgi:hypothetical protein